MNTTRRIEYYSKPNPKDGNRCHFALFWMADYHPGHPDGEHRVAERGQHFYADPVEHGFSREESK